MKSKLILSILIAIQAISYGLEFTQNGNELVFKTKRTRIKIVDARITEFWLRRGQGRSAVAPTGGQGGHRADEQDGTTDSNK